MSGFSTFHNVVFGEWGWEFTDPDGTVLDESRLGFETLEECLEDARRHGFVADAVSSEARKAGVTSVAPPEDVPTA